MRDTMVDTNMLTYAHTHTTHTHKPIYATSWYNRPVVVVDQ